MNGQASSSSSSSSAGNHLSLDLHGKFDLFASDVGPMESAVEQGGPPAVLQQIRACQQNGDRTGRFAVNSGVENGSWLSVENIANPYLLVTQGTGQFRFTFSAPSHSTYLTPETSPLSLLPTSSTEGCYLQPGTPSPSSFSLSPVEGVPGLWQGFFRILIEFNDDLKSKLREEDCGEEMYVEESFWAAKSLRQEEELEDAVDWMREDEDDGRDSDIEEEDEEMN